MKRDSKKSNRGYAALALPLLAATMIHAADAPEAIPAVDVLGTKITLYGFAQLDMAYDNNRSGAGNLLPTMTTSTTATYTPKIVTVPGGIPASGYADLAYYAYPQTKIKNDGDWGITANNTRIGFALAGPDGTVYKLTGKIEADFSGGGTSTTASSNETNPVLRLRHAYGNIAFPKFGLSILAGQTWDVIAPLNTPLINSANLWSAGNIGARRPQFRITEEIPVGPAKIIGQGALTRTIGPAGFINEADMGVATDMPSMQGRLAVSCPLWVDKQNFTIGAYGLWGKMEMDIDSVGTTRNLKTWAYGVDVELPIVSMLSIVAEGYAGQNMGAYQGNIGQYFTQVGATIATVTEVQGFGGWAALRFKPISRLTLNVGAGIDSVHTNTAALNTGRVKNESTFVNGFFNITKDIKVGVEYQYLATTYKVPTGVKSLAELKRIQGTFVYGF